MNRYTVIVTFDLRGAGSANYRKLDSLLSAAGYHRHYPSPDTEERTSNTYIRAAGSLAEGSLPDQLAPGILERAKVEIQAMIKEAEIFDCQAFIVAGREDCMHYTMTTYPSQPPRWQPGEANL